LEAVITGGNQMFLNITTQGRNQDAAPWTKSAWQRYDICPRIGRKMAKLDPLKLISVAEISERQIVPYTEETIRRYFRTGVLHIYERKDGVNLRTTEGSARIRFELFLKIARGKKRMSLDRAGKLITECSGPDDDFIRERLEKGVSENTTRKELFEKLQEKLSNV
jgi:hypothetical protein